MPGSRPRFTSNRKPEKCPSCGSTKVASILYGYPVFDDKLKKEMDDGKIVPGGCCIPENAPRWECVECGAKIRKGKMGTSLKS